MRAINAILTIAFSCAILSLSSPAAALACGTCYGAADSSATNGMNFAILSMLGITGTVLAAMTSFFLYLRRRARLYGATVDACEITTDNGGNL